jgi:Cd2+/Zn2+-exporting ATPase
VLISGWRELIFSRSITINLLMSIAAVGAIIIGETGEAATVVVLFSLGEALEGYTADRARYSIRALLAMVPQEATVLQPCMDCAEHLGQDDYTGGPCPFCGTHEARVPVGDLRIGDTILIAPGDRIPMDGAILSGESAVNQAPITGESVPVAKTTGDDVFAGSINGAGALEVRVTRLAADNTLSRIIAMVEEAQSQRAPTQRFIDRFARWYTPGVVLLALLVAFLPPLLFDAPFWDTADGSPGWLYRALALLIVACPCALVISTPVTIVSGLTNAAWRGILIKGGAPLEALAAIRTFAFDKTGTLTQGEPALVTCQSVDCAAYNPDQPCAACDDLLALAAAVERRSEHPLAHAIVRAAESRRLLDRYPAAQNVTSLTGRGVQGQIADQPITIGTHSFFDTQYPHPPALCQTVTALEAQGQTTMLLAEGSTVRGVLGVADSPRPASQNALRDLKALDPAVHTVMLTGDNATVAGVIGETLGVDEVRAQLLPGDKLDAILQISAQYGPVAMVGDGINDAPALAAATVGIAMGSGGSPQAMETADVVLMQDDLQRLPDAVHLSRRTLAIIHQNVGLSLGLKAVFLLLTLFGWSTLWMAVFADMGASLLVTFNGMRMLRN